MGGDRPVGPRDLDRYGLGVLYTMGYSIRYFDRFEESLPDDLGFTSAEHLLEEVDEDPSNADPYDAALVSWQSDAP